MSFNPTPPLQQTFGEKDRSKINSLSQQTGAALMSPPNVSIRPEDQERHRLYTLLLMSLVYTFWNGNRRGATGVYPYRSGQVTLGVPGAPGSVYGDGKPYLGHNIAAIAVDGVGKVVDFDFNHNEVFRSSVEHAEARLTRRMFSLTGLRDSIALNRAAPATENYANMLNSVTIYTSLEPCAQCAGIMSLAQVDAVVYLQVDDGTVRISNILFQLQPYSSAARPILASQCGIAYGDMLATKFQKYQQDVLTGDPFWKNPDTKEEDRSQSLASFLCTDDGRRVYESASTELDEFVKGTRQLGYPDYAPTNTGTPSTPASSAGSAQPLYTNRRVLEEVRDFLRYAQQRGFRGTPH